MANRFQRLIARAAKMVLGDALPGAAGDSTQTQAEFQRLNTGLGAEFGQELTKDDLWFTATREPVAHFLTFVLGSDVFDKMFTLKPLRKISPERFNQRAMDVLAELNAKAVLSKGRARKSTIDKPKNWRES